MSLAIQYRMKRKNGKETKEVEATPIKMAKGGDAKGRLKAKWEEEGPDREENGHGLPTGGWKMPYEGRVNTNAYAGRKPTPVPGGVNTKMRNLNLKTGEYRMHGPKGKLPMAEGGSVCAHCGGYADGGDVVKKVHKALRKEKVETDLASPNYVADFATNRGHKMTSDEVVKASDSYQYKKKKKMAEGGEALADFDSNDFENEGFHGDEANYTAANSGDELGDVEEQRRKSALLSYLRRKSA